jgi:ribonucleoside-triphosphate reductase
MELHRELRLIKPLTFPVTTMAMVHDGHDVIDKDYKELCAEEWAKGGSFFCYLSNNPSALASCCRVLNEMQENTFSSTTGLTGIMTGSCNVITLNINRIVQDWRKNRYKLEFNGPLIVTDYSSLKDYLISILERVYKYHIAYKTMLYDLEDKGMFSPSNGGYIYMKKLYSTIGLIGYTEAAQFLGMKVSNNKEYIDFLRFIFGTVKEQNKEHSIHNKKRPILFNSEAIPGEGLGVKLYEHDKKDGYWVPEDQNLYNCYFYNPWDNTSILDKFILHGKEVAPYCDGGQALHANLDAHLSKAQYLKLIDFAIEQGTNYFTFNIPMSECKNCGHVVNAPIQECPKCGSNKIDYWTRIIGYLRPVSAFSNPRKIEQKKRVYGANENIG